MRSNYLFTSESVSEGHPDKVADQISDAIVDLFLSKDPEARVACETMVTTQAHRHRRRNPLPGVYDEEISDTHGWAPGARDEIEQVVRHTIKRIGYEQAGFHWQTASFENHLHGQSATSPRASTPPATRTKAPATRASCSVSPATRPPS